MNPKSAAGPTSTETLFRGATITISDGRCVRVRQISLREYEQARRLLGDEIALTSFAAEMDGPLFAELSQEDYELLHAATRRVNEGFFRYAARRAEEAARSVPPEVMQRVIDAAVETATKANASGSLSPKPRPQPV